MVAEPPLSRMRATSAARFSGVLPSAIRVSTAVVRNLATSRGGEAERAGRAHHLALAHGDAGEHLVEVLAEADLHEQRSRSRRTRRLSVRRCGVGAELAHALGIGGDPGEAVGGVLLRSPSSRPRSCPRPTGSWCAPGGSPRRRDPWRPRPPRGPGSRDPAVRSRRRERLTWQTRWQRNEALPFIIGRFAAPVEASRRSCGTIPPEFIIREARKTLISLCYSRG